jgi:hypothetical protein
MQRLDEYSYPQCPYELEKYISSNNIGSDLRRVRTHEILLNRFLRSRNEQEPRLNTRQQKREKKKIQKITEKPATKHNKTS